MEKLRQRILDIAYNNKLSHLGSYFSSLEIIDEIYNKINKDDIFILSSGHAALALYVCLEKYYGLDAEVLFKKYGGHPHLDEENKIYCSTGSLGLGLPVAIGRALANTSRDVYVLISDGECAWADDWERYRVKRLAIEGCNERRNVIDYEWRQSSSCVAERRNWCFKWSWQ